ncbi:MAG: AbrB/MazE/SpoVT family DNA-binding domain-containing protein [Candidatus Bathyarchaeota archaeon]|nr:MAG: AbrB/MazE/SpoVT family DNA-binding domain-containing protein [Candidatus Bathyarchaeota archaeon]
MNLESFKEEMRKIQLTGGSTYIVSLPKDWVKQMGLERGSLVSITKLDDLSLRLQPKAAEKGDRPKRAIIGVSDADTPASVVRRVVSAYLLGYNIIQIRAPKSRMDSAYRFAVKDFTRKKLVGTEILSDLPQELTLQVLLSYSDLSVKDALQRMGIIAASMHREALATIGADDSRLAREVISMDDEVDRFSFYIIRLLKIAVSDSAVLRESGLKSPRECLGYRLITKSVERMADHAVNIATNSLAMTLSNLNEELLEELRGMSESALRVFEDSVEALFGGDYGMADTVFEMAEGTREMEAVAIQKIIKFAAPGDVPALRLIVESIIRTAEYGADIAEVVLNMTIRDEIREE